MAQWRILRRAPRRPYWIPGGRTSCRPSPGCVCRVWLPLQGERRALSRSVLGALANPCTRACRRHGKLSSTPPLRPFSSAPASRTTPTYHPKACVPGGLASRRATAYRAACHPRRCEVEIRRRRGRPSSTPLLRPSSSAPASQTTPTYHPKACVPGRLASRRATAHRVACHPRRHEVETRRRRLRRGRSRDRPLPTPSRRGRTIPRPS